MTWVYLIIGILVLAAIVAVGLVVTTRRKSAPTAPPPTADQTTVTEAPPTPPEAEVEPEPAPTPTVERPESTASRLVRLRQRLAGSQGGLGRGLLTLLSRDRLDEDTWEAIEDTLLTADVGVEPTQQVVEGLRTRLRVEGNTEDPRGILREELLKLVDPTLDRRLRISG